MAKSKGGKSAGKINTAVNSKCGDIYTAAKSLAGPAEYEKGYPAHDSLHLNKGGTKGRYKGGD